MSANRPRDTKPELLLRKALWQAGHRGYRINYRIELGGNPTGRKGAQRVSSPHVSKGSVRPDITFVSKKVAIFVHGCYWPPCQ
jgi:DNA mismatch endonuclease (patch repair protein)